MAELIPAPFQDLVTRLFCEPALQDSVFDLSCRNWYNPRVDDPDLTVRFHARAAGNPLGPASGPHTQVAQNILLSYVAGARILELKTVQVKDKLDIPRPCIDMTNIGYNVEWSQELAIADSLREYVAGMMLVEMFRRSTELAPVPYEHPGGRVVYDMSVGYDLAGIQSAKVQRFMDGMRDAIEVIDRLRSDIPGAFNFARDYDYPTRISDSVTLSTFHGCPADEVEGICEFLIAARDVDVIVKMNPPMLGKDRLEHLLHDVLGYTELTVNPQAYTSGLSFDESLELCRRLTDFAAARNRRIGFKFSNTLEVLNHKEFFTPDNEVMYLSGQPLHVITMTLTDAFREAVGPGVGISFSAGVDARNFGDTVACGFVPITVSTDLLRPGGYGRLPRYLQRLCDAMREVGARGLNQYLLKRFDQGTEAERRCADHRGVDAACMAGRLNTSIVARNVRAEPRYRAENNRKVPKRIDSHLEVFDCITCDKCIPVCPNAANFTYPTPIVAFDYQDILVDQAGNTHQAAQARHFEITEEAQIACYADFCNECGNCDTFCPEYGGPYIKKPSFFGTVESWDAAAPRDGFVITNATSGFRIQGRIQGATYELTRGRDVGRDIFTDGIVQAVFAAADHRLMSIELLKPINGQHRLDMGVYHTLRHLLDGVLDKSRINQVNAAYFTDSG
ncbi:MAG: glutamate synthase [Phycisphaerae bacterium]